MRFSETAPREYWPLLPLARSPTDRCPWHRLGPLHMSVVAKRCRQGAVAVPEARMSRGIAISPRQGIPPTTERRDTRHAPQADGLKSAKASRKTMEGNGSHRIAATEKSVTRPVDQSRP
jgi:hypothetical protein